MQYSAVISIDDDRWAKHPYSVKIVDENGNQVEYHDSLDSRAECKRIIDKYNISFSNITEEFY